MFDIFRTLFKYKEIESPDQMGFFPEKVHVEAFPERRYLWTSRFLVILSCLSVCFNIMLACAIYLMVPMISVTPRFYTINKHFNQIEQVQKRVIRYPVSDLITEQNIREYIITRYTMVGSVQEILNNWGASSPVYWYSSSNVYDTFFKFDIPADIRQYNQSGLQRRVGIEWVKPLSRGLWQVQFKTFETTREHPAPIITNWRATMRIVYTRMSNMSKENRIYNSYGFLIMSYSLTYHGIEGQNESYIDTARRRSQGR